ncbi:MAG TPA: hypothetical protein DCX06_02170 [Opitutae bacterium]|nr:hypothetical protein [Opitutae bacterium]
MRLFSSSLFRLIALCSLCAGSFTLQGQAPLLSGEVVAANAGDLIALDWRIESAERALRSGLIGLAETGLRTALKSPVLDAQREDVIRYHLAAALIAQQRYGAAALELDAIRESGRASRYYLYRAISIYGDGERVNRARFTETLKQVRAVELSTYDQPWWQVARALRAQLWDKPEEVVSAFESAVKVAQTDSQKAFFESLVFRQKLLETPSNEALAAEIREQLEQFTGQAAAYTYAREYAVILNNLGRSEDAIAVIDDQRVNNQSLSSREREQLLLLKGMIAGPNTLRGIEALQTLVRSGKTRDAMRVALQLLARDPKAVQGGLSDFLNQMVARAEPHALLGEIYYIRSQLALARAEEALKGDAPNVELAQTETANAERDAQYLLEQFPGLQQITNVYRLLAYAALQRKPAQYRAAADFLIQLRDQIEVTSERVALNRLIGDCYFLNADYVNAVDFYQAAYARSIDGSMDQGLFLRLITAEVRAGQMESALQHIDEADFSGNISVEDRWRAEWNVAQGLQANRRMDIALNRVRSLTQNVPSSVGASLDIRLLWLEAYLSFVVGEDATLLERVTALLERVESLPEQTFDPVEAKLLVTEIMLLQAQVMIRGGGANDGMTVLQRLRVGFADSSAAQRSYLSESDYHASINDFKAAQQALEKLAELYPQSVLAPQAIFEAGIYCERRGAEFYEAAVLLHNQIVENYPADNLVYAARLKQGDLLRKMNNFAGAQSLYETLINTYPIHPLRYIPELSRIDCMLALAKNDVTQLNDVIVSLERLMDIPNLPIDFQAEVGYKWGFTLLKRDAPEEAQEVFMMIFDDFLLKSERAAQVGPSGRYWLSRALLGLGKILEESGQLVEARRVYRKMVAFNLPGRNLALDRANSIQVLEDSVAQ